MSKSVIGSPADVAQLFSVIYSMEIQSKIPGVARTAPAVNPAGPATAPIQAPASAPAPAETPTTDLASVPSAAAMLSGAVPAGYQATNTTVPLTTQASAPVTQE